MRSAAALAVALTATLLSAVPADARAPEAVVQLAPGVSQAQGRAAIAAAHGTIVRDLHLIHGFGVRASRGALAALSADPAVANVTVDAPARPSALINFDPSKLRTNFNASVQSKDIWGSTTGKGIGVAVVDTGIDGGLPDFYTSQTDTTSRVVASVVTNPDATTATDTYGHGTHVAGIIAGDSGYRPANDPLRGLYAGVAPDASLISIKASDDDGNSSLIDVIYGIQFAVDHKSDYNIRVLNLSMNSTVAQSYLTDPLDAAVEQAWFSGIVVVVAAGNRGLDADAVDYAPANDPYVITVGGIDDMGTKDISDDTRAPWTSMGYTQDGFFKPDVGAPGAHIVSTLARGSRFKDLCSGCVRDGGPYFQAGGTSMAAPVVSGAVADILKVHPTWTPDQVKGAIINTLRAVKNSNGVGVELSAKDANGASKDKLVANVGLTPNELVDPATGAIDYTRASWSRASWSSAADVLRASWSRASWSCDCSRTDDGSVDPTRASWSRASWSTSWDK